MLHVHPFHHLADVVRAGFRHSVTGGDVGNIGCGHVVAVFAEAVANGGALVAKAEQILEGCAGLGIAVIVTGDQRHIVQPVHDLVSANCNVVEGGEAGEQILILAKLHHHVHVQNGNTGLVVKVTDHGADGHVSGAVEAEVDLTLKAKAQQAAGDGAKVIDALPDADLHCAAAGSGGAGVEVGQTCQHQTVTGLCHFQRVGLGNNGLAVQREAAVHFRSTHGDDDNVIAGKIILNLAVQHFSKNTRTHNKLLSIGRIRRHGIAVPPERVVSRITQ